jgi:hypothetical protein
MPEVIPTPFPGSDEDKAYIKSILQNRENLDTDIRDLANDVVGTCPHLIKKEVIDYMYLVLLGAES